ncbi:MAG: MarR family winged helix-turn-helix transcriptional regulator [Thermocrispum sp.]
MSEAVEATVTAPLVPGAIAEHNSCLVLKLGQVMFRIVESRLAELGMRTRHYSVLQALFDAGPASQLDLGRCLRIDPATMVSTLDDLQRLAAVTCTRAAHDRRRQVVDAEQGPQLGGLLRRLSEGEALPATFDSLRYG